MTTDFSSKEERQLEDVHRGMTVLDVNGDNVGKVDQVKMGDPQAVTTRGQELDTEAGWMDVLARSVGGGGLDVPPERAQRLVRVGFMKVDARGWFNSDLYVEPQQIAGVVGEEVHLRVHRDDLLQAR